MRIVKTIVICLMVGLLAIPMVIWRAVGSFFDHMHGCYCFVMDLFFGDL